jgi:hypothetical protein
MEGHTKKSEVFTGLVLYSLNKQKAPGKGPSHLITNQRLD